MIIYNLHLSGQQSVPVELLLGFIPVLLSSSEPLLQVM